MQIDVNAKVNTGAMSNLLPKEVYKKLHKVPLKATAIRLIAFGGTTIDQEGTCQLGVRFHNRFISATFHVANSKGPILIGLQTSRELGLVTPNLAVKSVATATKNHQVQTMTKHPSRIQNQFQCQDQVGKEI